MKKSLFIFLTLAVIAAGCNKSEVIEKDPPVISFDGDGRGIYELTRGGSITVTPEVTNANGNVSYAWLLDGAIVGDKASIKYDGTAAGDVSLTFRVEADNGRAETNVLIKVYYEAPTVFEFRPAPGQFINEGYTATTMEQACRWAETAMERYNYISLGGFGGYIVVGLGSSIVNGRGKGDGYDFAILGNSYSGSSEPGIVWVMRDDNGDGAPNDTWYELKGSEDANAEAEDRPTRGYWVKYHRPTSDGDPVQWEDSDGETGEISRISAHSQPYYPRWVAEDEYTWTGTMLKPRNSIGSNGNWVNAAYGWGYADNYEADGRRDANKPMANYFNIDNAIDGNGLPAALDRIDFIKVQSAINAQSGALGEVSTEVCGFIDLNKE